jgi:hypothetical protein
MYEHSCTQRRWIIGLWLYGNVIHSTDVDFELYVRRLALKNYSGGRDSIGLWGVWMAALCGILYQFVFHER